MRKSFSIVFIVLLSLGLVCTRPFDIYADASDGEFDNDSVVGVQVEEYEEELSGVQGTRYRFNIILDGFYVGEFQIHVEYDSYNVSTSNWDHYTIDRDVYVCGYDTYFETWMRSNWLPPSSITWSASVQNTDQCVFVGRMESDQLLNLLINFRNTYTTNSSVVNGFLNQIDLKIDTLIKQKNWNFPIESLSYIYPYFHTYNLIPIGMSSDNYYTFPIFSLNSNNYVIDHVVSTNSKYTYIFFIQGDYAYNASGILNYIDLPSNCTISNYNYLYQTRFFGQQALYLVKFDIQSTSSNVRVKIKQGLSNVLFIPVYHGVSTNKYLSTEFCLQFGLTNSFLDNINAIANGTTQTNNSSSNLEDMNDDYDDVSQQVFGLENNFSTGFDSSMQNVPTTFNFGTQFGNKFLATATWVRNQFDTMTTNTPFGALITFSLVLGLALLIVGRRLL